MPDKTEELVQQASQGDAVALDSLLAQYLPDLETFVRLRVGLRLGAKESSSDLVQSVCREVLQDLDQVEYRGERAFKQWLFLAAVRKIKDRAKFWQRGRRAAEREAADIGVSGALHDATPSQELIQAEDVAALERALAELPEDYRTVITLSRFLGMSNDEIATEMERSPGAVSVLLHRALAKLGVLLDEQEQ